MDSILQAHEQLEKRGNLEKAVQDVDQMIALLQRSRDAIVADPSSAPLAMAKLKQPIEKSFVALDDDLKEVNKGLNQYQKALDKSFKKNTLPTASTEPLAEQPALIERAIVMHLLREGKFHVARTLVGDIVDANNRKSSGPQRNQVSPVEAEYMVEKYMRELIDLDVVKTLDGTNGLEQGEGWLQKKFTEMYTVLDALRNHHDLEPAIQWARQHSQDLEQRGSNLEFELSRLKFIELYHSEDIMDEDDPWSGPIRALGYAQTTFQALSRRYVHETSNLAGSLAYSSGLQISPYQNLFCDTTAWQDASDSFAREFCGLLGLSEKSPLYTAVTAGGIALPVLEKVERIMAQTRGQWTSVNELPVETPLPHTFRFHSVFVCPVSKEQGTDDNPPMMLPCGHVIARESLDAHSRGKNRMKCPYCPAECAPKDAKRIFI